MRAFLFAATSALSLCFASFACAQDGPPVPASAAAPAEWRLDVGGGVYTHPEYPGSDEYIAGVVPAFALSYGDILTIRPGDGARLRVLHDGDSGLEAGLTGNVRFGREESDDRRLRGLGDIDDAIEGGGYVAYKTGDWSFSASAVTALNDSYDGVIGEFGATWTGVTPIGLLSVGPRLRVVSDGVNESYYGIDAQQSLRSGRAQYHPSGGLQSAGVSAGLLIPLSDRFTVGGLASYERLLGDAADSPIAREGSENQLFAGVFLGYRLF